MHPRDWLDGPNMRGQTADDAAIYLMRLALRDHSQIPRVRDVVERSISEGDLIFTPWIIRKQMFRHGLANGLPPQPSDGI
jgi:hypothetical protein